MNNINIYIEKLRESGLRPTRQRLKICEVLFSTEKTFQEIETYSNSINKKYIFGIYDCRHYVDKMSVFCDTGNIPIWNLKSYF